MTMRNSKRAGFTLIELLVTIGIIALLAALLIPAVQSSRLSAARVSCKNNLKQLALGLHTYHESHQCFPPGSYVMGISFPQQTGWGWGAMILPYVEQGPLYERINFRMNTGVGGNLAVIATPVPLFRCPSEVAGARISCKPLDEPPYELASGNYSGSEGILYSMSSTRIGDILDGSTHTFLLGERVVQSGADGGLPFTSAWCGQVSFADDYDYRSVPHLLPSPVHPINATQTDPLCFGSRHPGGAHFALADGSTRFVNQTINLNVFQALGSTNGGEAVELP